MARGQLRVYLGLAPGVGKTYKMLDEGWRRRERGADVAVGYVETHQRAHTQSQLRDIEVVARKHYQYRGATLEEMDLESILARHPEVALVDELAHTNAPGSLHEKRWQDVEDLLDAGIDVITTVNIQHLESVNDVVEKITGIVQRETVPDFVVRRAEQIELVDITPEALRRRMAHGNIYPPDKIDASLTNFFRSGNLTALRELSLLWLADRVEDSLQVYLDANGITARWETRERLIVAVTGNGADEVLLRRAARIASRNHAEILAIHVVDSGAVRSRSSDTTLARELVAEFEGTFHEVIDEDVASALVTFARAERGTQMILGSSRTSQHWRWTAGVIGKVLRLARDFDVHVVAVTPERKARTPHRRRNHTVSWLHTLRFAVLAAAALVLLTVVMSYLRSGASLSTVFLAYLVVVVALAARGGMVVGTVAALGASGLENYYFVDPLHTLQVARPDDAVAIVAFLVCGIGASLAMNEIHRRSDGARRARSEAALLSEAATTVGSSREDLLPLLDTLRSVFQVSTVALMSAREGRLLPELVSGDPVDTLGDHLDIAVNEATVLRLSAVELGNQDRRLISSFADQLALALRYQDMTVEAEEMRARAESDSLRVGMLQSVAHDLKPALINIERNVLSLRASTSISAEQRDSLDSISRQVQNLARLVINPLDSGRFEAKKVTSRRGRANVKELVDTALSMMDMRGRLIEVDLAKELPSIVTDPELLELVIVNLVAHACTFSCPDQPVRITAGCTNGVLELLVIDRGPCTRDARRRLPVLMPESLKWDLSSSDDFRLSLALGFVKVLGGQIRFEDTPGGGLTAVVSLTFETPSTVVGSPND